MSSVLPPWPELSCASGVAVRRCTALAALFTRLKSEVAMRIADFLFANFLPQQRATIAFQAGIADHLGAFIRQIWPNGRVLIVAQPRYREYCERKLIAELRAQGVDAPYCLCLEQPGVTPLQQIQESLSDGVLEKLSAIFSLGDNILFKYVREQSSIVGIPCGALLDEFADPHAFDAIAENIPFASAIFFDIDAIAERLKGRTDDAICALETELYSLKADMLAINSFNKPVNKILLDAVEQSAPDRSLAKYAPDEDSLAQLAESYSWFAISCRIFHEMQETSFETVADYVRAAADMPTFTHTQHARLWRKSSMPPSKSNRSKSTPTPAPAASHPKKSSRAHSNKRSSKTASISPGSNARRRIIPTVSPCATNSIRFYSIGMNFVHTYAPLPTSCAPLLPTTPRPMTSIPRSKMPGFTPPALPQNTAISSYSPIWASSNRLYICNFELGGAISPTAQYARLRGYFAYGSIRHALRSYLPAANTPRSSGYAGKRHTPSMFDYNSFLRAFLR